MIKNDNCYKIELAKTIGNCEKVVFNEVQRDFFRKESDYFGSVKMSIPSGGSVLYFNEQIKNAEQEKDLLKYDMNEKKNLKSSKKIQVKGVGFDLLYTKNCPSSEEATTQEINLEMPCKIVMALVLIVYILNQNISSQLINLKKVLNEQNLLLFKSWTDNFTKGSVDVACKNEKMKTEFSISSLLKKKDFWKFNSWLKNFSPGILKKDTNELNFSNKYNAKNKEGWFEKMTIFIRNWI